MAGGLRLLADAKDFGTALTTASRAASARQSVEVLGGVKIETGDNGCAFLTCTDMSSVIRSSVVAKVKRKGETVAVPAKRLLTAIQTFEGEVEIVHDESQQLLALKQGATTVRLQTRPVADFPKVPTAIGKKVKLDADTFLGTWDSIKDSFSKDESRPVLTGVKLELGNGAMRMISTDSYRLAIDEFSIKAKSQLETIVPGTGLALAARLLKGHKAVTMGVHEKWVGFQIGYTLLLTRAIEGTFPNWQQLLPDNFPSRVELPRAQTLAAVKRIEKILGSRVHPVEIVLKRDHDTRLTVREQGITTMEEQIVGAQPELAEPELRAGFNPRFFADGLNMFEGETVTLHAVSPLRPFVIDDEGDTNARYLMMPIRLS